MKVDFDSVRSRIKAEDCRIINEKQGISPHKVVTTEKFPSRGDALKSGRRDERLERSVWGGGEAGTGLYA